MKSPIPEQLPFLVLSLTLKKFRFSLNYLVKVWFVFFQSFTNKIKLCIWYEMTIFYIDTKHFNDVMLAMIHTSVHHENPLFIKTGISPVFKRVDRKQWASGMTRVVLEYCAIIDIQSSLLITLHRFFTSPRCQSVSYCTHQ